MILKDKIAIITGSSQGIGRAIAIGLAKEGAHLVINYCSSRMKGEEVVEKITSMKRKAILIKADVSKREEIEHLVKVTLENFGKIDILVNNAGIGIPADFFELTEEIWDKVFSVDLKGTFLCSQIVAKEMVKQGKGKIINVSSISGKIVTSTFIPYCCAKAGIDMLTKGMAVALAPYGINVNGIAPGVIQTEYMEKVLKSYDNKKRIFERTPSGIIGQPGDCVGAVVFLASEASNHIYGETITIDGGYMLTGPEWRNKREAK